MDNNRNIDSFEESLRNSIQGVEIAPSPELWGRIEASLDKPASVSPWLTATKWGGAIAASVAVALAMNILFTPEILKEPYTAMLSSDEFVELENLPISLDPIRLSQPQFIHAAQNSDSAPIDVEYTEVTEVTKEPKTEPTPQVTKEAEPEKRTSRSEPPVVITAPNAIVIDSERILGKKRTRRYATSAAVAALAATGASLIDFTASPSVDGYNLTEELYNDLELFGPGNLDPDENASLLTSETYNPTEAIHSLPISYGVSVAHRLGKRWSLESGANYTRLNSQITLEQATEPYKQVVEFIGVPLRVNYDIYSTNRFSIYTGVGGQIERCITATLDSESLEENDWHFSAKGAIGAQYKVCSWLGVYAEPEAGYYFTPTQLRTIRTENPLNFNLRFGVRLLLGE